MDAARAALRIFFSRKSKRPAAASNRKERRRDMTEVDFCQRAEALKGQLYRTALFYLGSEADAVNAVDEAVFKGLTGRKRLKDESLFNTWLTRILINACNDELRRRKREVSLDAIPEEAAQDYDALPLREAMGKLPQQLRQIVVLRFFSQLTLEETAAALGLPRGTVSTKQRKALELLRLELSDEEGDPI